MLYNDKFTVIANWKMNPCRYKQAKDLISNYLKIPLISKINLIVAVPYVYLSLLSRSSQSKLFRFSSQNLSYEESGAFTGEISAAMLQDLQVNYSIIGHSEGRKNFKESNVAIANKLAVAIKFGLVPIVCIGETKAQFAEGDLAVQQALIKQLDPIKAKINQIKKNRKIDLLIAYEPIWAIGTGLKVKINYLQKIFKFIKQSMQEINNHSINCYILYGGSVNADNVKSIKSIHGLAGILVGGGSLDPAQFTNIIRNVLT